MVVVSPQYLRAGIPELLSSMNWWGRPEPAPSEAELQVLVSASGRDDALAAVTKAVVRARAVLAAKPAVPLSLFCAVSPG